MLVNENAGAPDRRSADGMADGTASDDEREASVERGWQGTHVAPPMVAACPPRFPGQRGRDRPIILPDDSRNDVRFQ